MKIPLIEQQIYNCYLRHQRNGQAWKPRKNFDDISDSTCLYLKKLHAFFIKFPHIKWDDFFGAPRFLHPDESTPPLSFFITRAAIKSYSLFQKAILDQSPDNQIEDIKEGFKFITEYCLSQNIPLSQYLHICHGTMPVWTEHYRLHLVNPYCLMELGGLDIFNFESDERDTWIPNLAEQLSAFRNRYHNSNKAKSLVKEATQKVKTFIDLKLKSNSHSVNINQ